MKMTTWRENYTKIFNEAPVERVKLLSDREMGVLTTMLDNPGFSQEGIGKVLGISSTHVSKTLAAAADKLLVNAPGPVVEKTEKAQRTTRTSVSHIDLMRLSAWAMENKDKLHNLPLQAMIGMVLKDLGIAVSEKTMKSVCDTLKIQIKVKPRFYAESQVNKTLAKHMVNLYTQLGVAVPDDLWELAGGRDDA